MSALKDAGLEGIDITEDNLDEFNASLEESGLLDGALDIWISKGDKMIIQTVFDYAVDGKDVKARFTVDSYNQPVEVEKPENSKTIMEIIGEFSGSLDQLQAEFMPTAAEPQTGISL